MTQWNVEVTMRVEVEADSEEQARGAALAAASVTEEELVKMLIQRRYE